VEAEEEEKIRLKQYVSFVRRGDIIKVSFNFDEARFDSSIYTHASSDLRKLK